MLEKGVISFWYHNKDEECAPKESQQIHDVMISLLCQNNIVTLFWHNNAIITSCACWECLYWCLLGDTLSSPIFLKWKCVNKSVYLNKSLHKWHQYKPLSYDVFSEYGYRFSGHSSNHRKNWIWKICKTEKITLKIFRISELNILTMGCKDMWKADENSTRLTLPAQRPGRHFKNTYELLNLRALKISMSYKNHIFQCMGQIFCVEFQRYPLKFHTKYLTHTLKDIIFIQHQNFKSS